jgi:hypothetical protein
MNTRRSRLLFDLGLLAAIVVLLVWLGQLAEAVRHPPQPAGPLDFKLVQERFARVHPGMRSEEVFELLGPQHSARFWEPEIERIDGVVKAHPDRYPGEGYWAKWADPEDESKWVAVFIAGGQVHHSLKGGF